jgi:hypothetical protein
MCMRTATRCRPKGCRVDGGHEQRRNFALRFFPPALPAEYQSEIWVET